MIRSRRATAVTVAACALVALASTARAQDESVPPATELGVAAEVERDDEPDLAGRSHSTVTREELDERLPRSAPDALRSVPGVSVQQTAHGQASPYVRGLTGQRVVHLFDGIRLNTGIYRQGPNQYFFTVDSLTLERLEVLRGSASTRYGSDALGGAILAIPRERSPDVSQEGLHIEPRIYARFRSADLEWGGRAEMGADLGERTSFLGGVGWRDADRLRSGGVVGSPIDGERARVPRFTEELEGRPRSDWRTQVGTGFEELTFDGRLVHRVGPRLRAIAAAYGYRQSDAPRTDRCPPPEAPADECLRVREQFRTLAYLALRGDAGPQVRELDLSISYQRHHEWRENDRPRSFVRLDWRDDVDTYGVAFSAATDRLALGTQSHLKLRYGVDAYTDAVGSQASQSLTDLGLTIAASRGQYLDRSSHATLGTFLAFELHAAPWLIARSGVRAGLVGVRAPSDPESGTRRVANEYPVAIGRASIELRPISELSIFVNVDQGFRAPNLDDLTSRQQTGPGFQFENPDLRPERSLSFDTGARVAIGPVVLEGWGFALLLEDEIARVLRSASDCPPRTPECTASRTQLSLVNTPGLGTILGVEGGATLTLAEGFTARATASYAWGEGPDPRDGDAMRVPLSRVPPASGTIEGRYRHRETGLYVGVVMRWAATQDRLAPSDAADPRIPSGGTPGWITADVMGGWRLDERVLLSVAVENLFDVAYRVHGSSINAPGIGVMAAASMRLWPW